MYWCMRHQISYPESSYCSQCFMAVTQNDEVKIMHCENKDQAQALANFLWNEKRRHMKDIHSINDDLLSLKVKWDVIPNNVVAFVKP